MADDWKPGDLALCIDGREWFVPETNEDTPGPGLGSINTVEAAYIATDVWGECLCLRFVEWPGADDEFDATAFRKINPLTPEEYEAEWTELLSSNPVKEGCDG